VVIKVGLTGLISYLPQKALHYPQKFTRDFQIFWYGDDKTQPIFKRFEVRFSLFGINCSPSFNSKYKSVLNVIVYFHITFWLFVSKIHLFVKKLVKSSVMVGR
jgi:hypothetical protein